MSTLMRNIVKKELIHSGVHPSVHVTEVFSSPGDARLVHRFGLTPGSAFDLRTGWDLNDTAQRAKMWSHLQHDRPTLIVGSWSGQDEDVSLYTNTLKICLRMQRFVQLNRLWCLVSTGMTFLTNCEDIHNHLSKLNCRSHIAENCFAAMIRGLRQALTRIGCLQAFESGPTVEEPCLAEMADYDQVYCDNVTGAAFPSKLCEEAMELEIKFMKEMNLYTPCEHEAMKEQGLSPIGTRWVFTNKGDTEHPFIRARLVAQETKKTTTMDLTDTSMTFAATPLVEGFRLLLSRAMTGEKKRNPQDELVEALFDISRSHFHSPVRRKVAIRMEGCPLCPSGIAMLNRAMYGTKDAAQCFGLYCERTMEKLKCNIGVFNPCLYKHLVKGISVLRHCDDFATLGTRTQIAEFKEELSKPLLVKHIATLSPRPQLLDSCEVRFLNRVIRWIVSPFAKAPERIEIGADPRHAEL